MVGHIVSTFAQLVYNGPQPLSGDSQQTIKSIMEIVLAILGSISFIVLVLAGLRLTASRGNPEAIAKLRSTVIYAAIGLAVSTSAGLIIQFVIGHS